MFVKIERAENPETASFVIEPIRLTPEQVSQGEMIFGSRINKAWAGAIRARLSLNQMEIRNLSVHPEYRGYGVGGSLLRAMEGYGKGNGCAVVSIAARNMRAVRFFIHADYRVTSSDRTGQKMTFILQKYFS